LTREFVRVVGQAFQLILSENCRRCVRVRIRAYSSIGDVILNIDHLRLDFQRQLNIQCCAAVNVEGAPLVSFEIRRRHFDVIPAGRKPCKCILTIRVGCLSLNSRRTPQLNCCGWDAGAGRIRDDSAECALSRILPKGKARK